MSHRLPVTGTRAPRSPRGTFATLTLAALALAACSADPTSPAATPASSTPEAPGTPNTPPAPATVVRFTPCTTPTTAPVVFVAYQDGTGAWKRVQAVGGHYDLPFTKALGGVAITEDYGSDGTGTDISYGTVAELKESLSWGCTTTAKNSVEVKGLLAGQTAGVSLGFNAAYVNGPGDKLASVTVPVNGTSLFAVLGRPDTAVTRMVLRRDVANATGVQSPIDFSAAEAFTPTRGAVRFAGDAPTSVSMWFLSHAGRHQLMTSRKPQGGTLDIFGLPGDRTLAGEGYEIYGSYPGDVMGPWNVSRAVEAEFRSVETIDVPGTALPATAPTGDVTASGTTVRARLTWQAPTDLRAISLSLQGNSDRVSIRADWSRAYLSTGTLDLSFPDLGGVAGWNAAWLPRTGQTVRIGSSYRTWTTELGGFYTPRAPSIVGHVVSFSRSVTM